MNLISTNIKTMSSREIAELTGKEHRHVRRDIQIMCEQLKIDESRFGHTYVDSMNRNQYEYLLDQETSLCLVAGYSAPLRMAIIKRWKELEDQALKPQLPDFTNPVEAARAWANEVEAKQLAQEQLQLAAPKVEYYDRVADVHNYMNATTVGQKVGLSGTALNKQLEQFNVYNRAIKTGRVFQQWFVDQGLGVMKKTDNGYNQSRFTNKGEQWVIQKFISEGLV